jgi:hypothetical protein
MCGQTCCLQLVGGKGYLKRQLNTAVVDHAHSQKRGNRSLLGHYLYDEMECKAFYMGHRIRQSLAKLD